ncbi:hypothetical protein LG634_31255 [Streptomyces bambusae]|uniref:hypothetical protein n=1 Tax=Streptomyces bambusae TaxID=1550616 RepID=UPI001CFFED22|nr:hypothetical protein [Streptomyces bambusae]MCB5169275.1 hypothetical protein [Streptomyces bambusae]
MKEQNGTSGQWRVDFDAEVVFSNGGALRTQGFRLDVPGDSIGDAELGELLVRHLGLLMVGRTRITRKEMVREAHKGSRGTGTGSGSGPRQVVDLTGPDTRIARPAGAEGASGPAALAALVDLPVALVRLTGAAEPVAGRPALAPFDLAGHAVVVETGRTGGPYLTEDAVALLAARGAALVATDSTVDTGPAAAALAAAGLPAVTGLTGLAALPAAGARLHAVPGPQACGPWLRAYAVVPGAGG